MGKFRRVVQRSTRRCLYHAYQIVLIFLRNEPGRHVVVHEIRGRKSGKEDHQQQITQFQGDVNDLRIRSAKPKDEGIDTACKRRIATCKELDACPVQYLVLLFLTTQEESRERRRKRQRIKR